MCASVTVRVCLEEKESIRVEHLKGKWAHRALATVSSKYARFWEVLMHDIGGRGGGSQLEGLAGG